MNRWDDRRDQKYFELRDWKFDLEVLTVVGTVPNHQFQLSQPPPGVPGAREPAPARTPRHQQ
jgi:hypothetical protein